MPETVTTKTVTIYIKKTRPATYCELHLKRLFELNMDNVFEQYTLRATKALRSCYSKVSDFQNPPRSKLEFIKLF